MWAELGISSRTGIVVLVALYFIIKWAVKSAVKSAIRESFEEITAIKAKDGNEEEFADGYAPEG